jgi:hypothetical protein
MTISLGQAPGKRVKTSYFPLHLSGHGSACDIAKFVNTAVAAALFSPLSICSDEVGMSSSGRSFEECGSLAMGCNRRGNTCELYC